VKSRHGWSLASRGPRGGLAQLPPSMIGRVVLSPVLLFALPGILAAPNRSHLGLALARGLGSREVRGEDARQSPRKELK
jgi:hypothetical protein